MIGHDHRRGEQLAGSARGWRAATGSGAWCAAGALVGAKLVFPGVALDGASLYELFEKEGVTFTLSPGFRGITLRTVPKNIPLQLDPPNHAAFRAPLNKVFKDEGYNLRKVIRAAFVHDDFVRF